MNIKVRSVLWLGLLTACLVSGCAFEVIAQNAPVTTIGTVINAVPNQQVVVPVTVTGFNNISSITLTIDYNYSEIQYNSFVLNPTLALASGDFSAGQTDLPGGFKRLILMWIGSIPGSTLPDLSTIVDLTFTYLAGAPSLQFFDSGDDCEYVEYFDSKFTKLNDTPTSTYYINGMVSEPILDNVVVNTKVFLEGPYVGSGLMSTALNSIIPLSQPYNTLPWNYTGTESVTTMPSDVTDWVLVELRTGTAASTKVATRAGFLKSNGLITELDGSSLLDIQGVSPGNYYIIIRHRNHIDIMSTTAIALSGNSNLYDFSTAVTQAYGGLAGYKQIGTGVYGMVAGDIDGDGNIYVSDFTVWSGSSGTTGMYNNSDLDFDRNIYVSDFTFWAINSGTIDPIPKTKGLNIRMNNERSIYSSQVH